MTTTAKQRESLFLQNPSIQNRSWGQLARIVEQAVVHGQKYQADDLQRLRSIADSVTADAARLQAAVTSMEAL